MEWSGCRGHGPSSDLTRGWPRLQPADHGHTASTQTMFDDAQNGEMETSGPIIGGDKLSNSLLITMSNNAYMSGTRQSG